MPFIRFVYSLLFAFTACVTLYLTVLTVAACFFKRRKTSSEPVLKLTVVIPAHNEEQQIGQAIDAVRKARYPQDACELLVIADNCEDETASIARDAAARVFERTDPHNRGKGQALDWFFRNHTDAYKHCDGVVVIDADTLVDGEFLHEISAGLSGDDIDAVQGYYGVSNPTESWRTALMAAALAVFHHVRPAGRNQLGGTAGLKGNGMAFRTGMLVRYGWPAHSIVEDLEFSTRLLLDGILVHYLPDAVVYGEMAATRKQAETQRMRWEGGRFQVFARYAQPLLGAWLKKRKMCYFDGFMELLIPPLSLLVVMLGVLLLLTLVFFPAMTPIACCLLLMAAFYVFTGLALRKEPAAVWLNLFAAPLFILWKIPLYLGMFRGKDSNRWIRTQRRQERQK